MKTKIKWWLEEILEKRWIRIILGILTIIFPILLILAWEGAIPVKTEIGKWFLLIIVLALPVYLAISGISVLIKSLIEGFEAKTSPMSKGLFICSLVSLIIGFHELYYYFRGSKLGLITALLSFIIHYICSYLLEQK